MASWQSNFRYFRAALRLKADRSLLDVYDCFGRGAVVQKSLRETARLSYLPLAVWAGEGPNWAHCSGLVNPTTGVLSSSRNVISGLFAWLTGKIVRESG